MSIQQYLDGVPYANKPWSRLSVYSIDCGNITAQSITGPTGSSMYVQDIKCNTIVAATGGQFSQLVGTNNTLENILFNNATGLGSLSLPDMTGSFTCDSYTGPWTTKQTLSVGYSKTYNNVVTLKLSSVAASAAGGSSQYIAFTGIPGSLFGKSITTFIPTVVSDNAVFTDGTIKLLGPANATGSIYIYKGYTGPFIDGGVSGIESNSLITFNNSI